MKFLNDFWSYPP